jgi:hypothetical protein
MPSFAFKSKGETINSTFDYLSMAMGMHEINIHIWYTSGHIYIYDARRLIKSIVKQKYSCMASKTEHFLWQIQALIPDFCVILQNNIETISEYTYIHTYIYILLKTW